MRRRVHTIWAILTSLMIALTGCRPQQPFYMHNDGDLSHYIDVATQIDYPDVCETPLDDVTCALPPFTLENLTPESYWELSLEDTIKTALANAKVFRSLGGRFVSSAFNNRAQTGEAPDAITLSPDAVRTVYDPAIVETQPFAGVEHALSAFDAQWATNLFYNKNDRQQNVLPQNNIQQFFRQIFQQDTSTFNSSITKISAQGGQFSVRNNIIYDFNNNPTRQVAKDWNANYELSFIQPLLAGAGVEYNRIAGPFNPFSNIPGGPNQSPAFDGVLLARINVDISLAEFEAGVRNLVSETENAYWELNFAWRNLETSNTALASARQTWSKIHQLYLVGTRGGEAKEEAQARAQYFRFKSTTETILNELLRAENRLRYIMGIAVTDGRLIKPTDKPTVARINFDWREVTEEALGRSLDLRRQKWRIKQRELELIAAKNLLLPRLDLSGTYRFQGLGDKLIGRDPDGFDANAPPQSLSFTGTSALQTLASGQFQEWALGMQMTMSLGFRKELATVRHFQLQLAKERAKLQDEQLEVSHQLADALRQLDYNYIVTIANFNATLASDDQVEAVQAAFDAQTVTLDQLLDAQRLRADSQTSFFRTLLDYQRAIIAIHFRKGSLLEYNNVYLAEGPWPCKAQFDAHNLARQRDASQYLDYGYSRPSVFSQGAIRQLDNNIEEFTTPKHGVPHEAVPREELPTPEGTISPMPDPLSSRQSKETRLRTASNEDRFSWGPLGLSGDQAGAEDATYANLTQSKAASGAKPAGPKQPASLQAVHREPTTGVNR